MGAWADRLFEAFSGGAIEMGKLEQFLAAQAKADQLKEEAMQEIREQLKDLQSQMGIAMRELLGEEILSMLPGEGVVVDAPPRRKVAQLPRTCYLNPEVLNIPKNMDDRMEALSRLPLNDIVPAVGNPEHSEVEWLRNASAEDRKKMRVPNPKWWFHPNTTDPERAAWKP